MGYTRCVFHKCDKTSLETSMFRFPVKDKDRLRVWINNSGNRYLNSLTNEQLSRSFICTAHFPSSSIHYGSLRNRLIGPANPYNYRSTEAADCTSSAGMETDVTLKVQAVKRTYTRKKVLESTKNYPAEHKKHEISAKIPQVKQVKMASQELSVQLCPLCTRRLTNHARFRECARAAQRLLTNLLSQKKQLASQTVKPVDKILALLPPFTIHHKHQFDLDIVHRDKKVVKVIVEKLPTENLDGLFSSRHDPLCMKDEKYDIDLAENDCERNTLFMDIDEVPVLFKVESHETIDNVEFIDESNVKFVSGHKHKQILIKEEKDYPDLFGDADSETDAAFMGLDDAPLKNNSIKTIDNVESICSNSDVNVLSIDNMSDSCDELIKRHEKENKVKTKVSIKTATNVTKEKKKRAKIATKEAKIDRRRNPVSGKVTYKGFFTITTLTLEDQLDLLEKRKNSKNYNNSPHKCTECFKGFLNKDAYARHMFRHNSQLGEFQCNVCKLRFISSAAMKRHHKNVHSELLKCNSCSFTTCNWTRAIHHQRWHNGTRFQCPHCPANFERNTSYLGHLRIRHPTDIACQLCGYSFVSQHGLEAHLNLTHRVDKRQLPTEGPRCEECDKIFATEEAFDNHRKIQHYKSKRNTPLKINKTSRKRKIPKGNGKLSLTCIDCGALFQSARRYNQHIQTHGRNRSNKNVQCHVCGKFFPNMAHLSYHMELHDESVTFPCPECGKLCKSRTRLYCHRRIHSSTDRPACPLCPMTFSNTGNRDRHVTYTHKTERDVKCEYCPKKFKCIESQRQHQVYTHQQKPWPKRDRSKKSEA